MTFKDLLDYLLGFIDALIPVVIGLAVLVFIWGLAQFITKSGDAKGVEKGKKTMLIGIIGLFVMVSVWGLVQILELTFDDILDNSTDVDAESLFE